MGKNKRDMVEQNSAMKSWIEYDETTSFPLENIPFGAFFNPTSKKVSCCTRIGDKVIDLAVFEHERMFTGPIFSKMSSHIFCNEGKDNAAVAVGMFNAKEI